MTEAGARVERSKLSLARRLKLQQLAVFEKVVESGSILAASRELHMTQPAVSKSIHELEAHFEGALFLRGKRGVKLTDFGVLIERHARTMLAELRYLADEVNAWNSGVGGQVTVGTLISASARLLPAAIARLRQTAPDVLVTVRVGSNAILFPALARGELDVIVGVLPAENDSPGGESVSNPLKHVSLYEETLCVVVARHHPLAAQSTVNPRDLQKLDWIIPTSESAARRAVKSFFDRAGMAVPRRRVESVSILTNLGLLLDAPMVALMPQSAAEQFVRAGLLSVLPMGTVSSFGEVGYTISANRPPSAATQRLLAALVEAGENLSRR